MSVNVKLINQKMGQACGTPTRDGPFPCRGAWTRVLTPLPLSANTHSGQAARGISSPDPGRPGQAEEGRPGAALGPGTRLGSVVTGPSQSRVFPQAHHGQGSGWELNGGRRQETPAEGWSLTADSPASSRPPCRTLTGRPEVARRLDAGVRSTSAHRNVSPGPAESFPHVPSGEAP